MSTVYTVLYAAEVVAASPQRDGRYGHGLCDLDYSPTHATYVQGRQSRRLLSSHVAHTSLNKERVAHGATGAAPWRARELITPVVGAAGRAFPRRAYLSRNRLLWRSLSTALDEDQREHRHAGHSDGQQRSRKGGPSPITKGEYMRFNEWYGLHHSMKNKVKPKWHSWVLLITYLCMCSGEVRRAYELFDSASHRGDLPNVLQEEDETPGLTDSETEEEKQ